jgi:hypothetical protein
MFSIIDIETGEILKQAFMAEGAQTNSSSGTFVSEEECSDELHYFVVEASGPALKDRPRLIEADEITLLADGIDALRIDEVPVGTMIIVRDNLKRAPGERYYFQAVDGFEFCTADPCDVTLEIVVPRSAFPLRSQRVRLVAHD